MSRTHVGGLRALANTFFLGSHRQLVQGVQFKVGERLGEEAGSFRANNPQTYFLNGQLFRSEQRPNTLGPLSDTDKPGFRGESPVGFALPRWASVALLSPFSGVTDKGSTIIMFFGPVFFGGAQLII